MITYAVVGVAGLVLVVASLVLGEFIDFGDGALSGTALGVGGVVFGAVGAIAETNGLPSTAAYVGSIAIGVGAILLIQRLTKGLRATEDGVPTSVVGVAGIATTEIDERRGEVRLESAQELERRLAWSDEPIPEGARVVVVEQSGSRVRVRQHFPND